jgi:hypothetical protein
VPEPGSPHRFARRITPALDPRASTYPRRDRPQGGRVFRSLGRSGDFGSWSRQGGDHGIRPDRPRRGLPLFASHTRQHQGRCPRGLTGKKRHDRRTCTLDPRGCRAVRRVNSDTNPATPPDHAHASSLGGFVDGARGRAHNLSGAAQ